MCSPITKRSFRASMFFDHFLRVDFVLLFKNLIIRHLYIGLKNNLSINYFIFILFINIFVGVSKTLFILNGKKFNSKKSKAAYLRFSGNLNSISTRFIVTFA